MSDIRRASVRMDRLLLQLSGVIWTDSSAIDGTGFSAHAATQAVIPSDSKARFRHSGRLKEVGAAKRAGWWTMRASPAATVPTTEEAIGRTEIMRQFGAESVTVPPPRNYRVIDDLAPSQASTYRGLQLLEKLYQAS